MFIEENITKNKLILIFQLNEIYGSKEEKENDETTTNSP